MSKIWKTFAFLLILIFLTSWAIFPLTTVKAQPKTIIVPYDYSTITSAIENATNGDIILIKSGTYEDNAIYTDKSLRIIGEGSQNTVINLKSRSFEIEMNVLGDKATFFDPAINITTNGLSISKITINSNGGNTIITGDKNQIIDISLTTALAIRGNYLDIEGNHFSKDSGINGSYSTIRGNIFANSVNYNGISFAGQYDIISSNSITGSGVHITTDLSLFTQNTIHGATGSFLIVSGNSNVINGNDIGHFAYGLLASGSNNTILKNKITDCGEGLLSRANNSCYANYIANNAWGLDTGGMSANGNPLSPHGDGSLNGSLLYRNNFVDNTYQVNTLFGANSGFFDNGKEGNYWSDYHGTDTNGDGIGDTPYVIDVNRSDRYPLMKPFNISNVPDLVPDWASTPVVQVINPTNSTYPSGIISLDFTVNKGTILMKYSLDGQKNITIQENATLTNLPVGTHNITVYSTDSYYITGSSNTVTFLVADSIESPLTVQVIPVIIIAIIVGLVLSFLLFRRRQKNT